MSTPKKTKTAKTSTSPSTKRSSKIKKTVLPKNTIVMIDLTGFAEAMKRSAPKIAKTTKRPPKKPPKKAG